MDRNILDITDNNFGNYTGFIPNTYRRYQAYDYLSYFGGNVVKIPFKYKDALTPFAELDHMMNRGIFKNYGALVKDTDWNLSEKKRMWLQRCIIPDNVIGFSPFYGESSHEDWIFPSSTLLECMAKKIRVSKTRMFLVSEISVKNEKTLFPVCCYLPFYGIYNNTDPDTYGYFSASAGTINSMTLFILTHNAISIYNPPKSGTPSLSLYTGLSRLVRPLTDDELDDYKNNYLGYGSTPHKLTICHPDTYESAPLGWIQY